MFPILFAILLLAPAEGILDDLLDRTAQMSPSAALAAGTAEPAPTATDEQFSVALARLPELPAASRLAAAQLLLRAGREEAVDAVLPLLASADLPLARALIAFLDTPALREHAPSRQALLPLLTSSPPIRSAAAVALAQSAGRAFRTEALTSLATMLQSEAADTRAHGALGLARLGRFDDEGVREAVEIVADGAGPLADLAASLLDTDRLSQRYRSKFQALHQLYSETEADSSGVKTAGDLRLLDEVLNRVETAHMEGENYSREELVAAAARGMLQLLDPHSTYFSGAEYGSFLFDMNPEYGGIGAFVNSVDDVFTIIRPIYSGPAYEVGLLSGDKILEVDGWPTQGEPSDEIIRRLKGKPGTPVEVLVYRRGWREPKEFTILRDLVEIPPLHQEFLPGNLLYLELISFDADSARLVGEAIRNAGSEIEGVVLDLRNNPGGLLSAAVEVSDLFLPRRRIVVTTRSRVERDETHYTRSRAAVDPDLPLAILVNEYSASASEIVAGALSIHGRATLVGERTFGKGSVQSLLPMRSLPDEEFQDENRNRLYDPWEQFADRDGDGDYDYGPHLKLTIAYYFLPDGTSIHKQRAHDGTVLSEGGVEPDISIPFPKLDSWKVPELDKLVADDHLAQFAEQLYDADPALAVTLAEFDGNDPARYPGFDAWYQELGTHLEPGDVRRYLRIYLRRTVADARGKVFPGSGLIGDYQEDPQLRAAIESVLTERGSSPAQVPEYALLAPFGADGG